MFLDLFFYLNLILGYWVFFMKFMFTLRKLDPFLCILFLLYILLVIIIKVYFLIVNTIVVVK